MKQWTLLAAAAASAPAIVYAVPVLPPAPAPALPLPPAWTADASLGYIRTTGNTDSSSLSVKADADWKSAPWENQFHVLGTYASSLGQSTAESYGLDYKLNRDLDPLQYVFASFDYGDDRFAGVVSRFSEAAGYGRHVVKSPMQTLDIDAGPGLSQAREAGYNGYDGEFIGVFDLNYLLTFSPTAHYKQTLHIEAGTLNTYINPVAELKFAIIGNVFATFDYDWRHNTSVPAGTVRTDTITSINFGYTFGKTPG